MTVYLVMSLNYAGDRDANPEGVYSDPERAQACKDRVTLKGKIAHIVERELDPKDE